MGVDVNERLLFAEQRAQTQREHRMLEDVGVIAGMEDMAIAEHRDGGPLRQVMLRRASARACLPSF